MIKEGLYYFPKVEGSDSPPFIAKDRAMRFCGCSIFTGIRIDNKEPAAWVRSCSDDHEEKMEEVYKVYEASMDCSRPDLDDLPAIQAADIVLNEVFPA